MAFGDFIISGVVRLYFQGSVTRPGSGPNSGIFSRRYMFNDSKGALQLNPIQS